MDRGARWTSVYGVTKLDMTKYSTAVEISFMVYHRILNIFPLYFNKNNKIKILIFKKEKNLKNKSIIGIAMTCPECRHYLISS